MKKSFSEQYELDRPLREAACQEWYKNKRCYKTRDEAFLKAGPGDWVSLVNTPMGW